MTNKIGVFDSGIGGLTIAKEIQHHIPGAQIIYFGDTAHLPYGDKSKELIIEYSKGIGDFLLQQGCQHIVIACNTASSFAYEELKKHLYGKAFVYSVIDPIVDFVCEHYESKNIGVIGTKGTITSRVYPRKINAKKKNIKVSSLATPLLAPMIEEGFYDNKISKTIIHSYLSKKELKNIDGIILGCTHYPLIKDSVEQFYKGKVDIIDSAKIIAAYIQKKMGTLPKPKTSPSHHFYVSDYTKSFAESAANFFGQKIKLEKRNIWAETSHQE